MSDALAQAVLDALDDDALDALAERLAPRIAERLPQADEWMETADAARYIGRSVTAMHKLTAARAIPFEQEKPGAKCYFLRTELDAWMRSQ